ncbi:hypothetical protein VC188_03595 [Polynucleobacter sp. MG-28-Ekke-A2]|uniref:hypothetical protein n=1 Tax=Polynucleobacter sp. MG-28-Ekke-A2 TaxID=3108276 RepID=UPI002B223FAB|nr:hypothetical protein [Polynucleobacter sp. MG-28-Ekke-A2]MEA9601206.1 hypothetical protein [Polynucleobacter sp. MG-28-Ekke-A2]
MNKKISEELSPIQVNRQDEDDKQSNSAMGRRKALAKIGKFSAYAAPATIAILNSKAAHAS